MKTILSTLLISFSVFGQINDEERTILRQKCMDFCEFRGGTFAIWFFVDVKKAQAVCKNGEKKNFGLDN